MNDDGGDVVDNDSGCKTSDDGEAEGCGNDEDNEHAHGGDGESIVDVDDDVDGDSADKNNDDVVDHGGVKH